MYKICFFVPETHVDVVKIALFEQGAGRVGEYEYCSWQVLGTGQFRPLAGSSPFIGELNQLTQVAEFKVEMVCDEAYIKAAIKALLLAHPYQQPAYEVYKILSLKDFS